MRKETDADQIDFNKKILHMSWHPFEDSIAIAATNNVSARRIMFGSALISFQLFVFSAFQLVGVALLVFVDGLAGLYLAALIILQALVLPDPNDRDAPRPARSLHLLLRQPQSLAAMRTGAGW